jgi:hypothetical protein
LPIPSDPLPEGIDNPLEQFAEGIGNPLEAYASCLINKERGKHFAICLKNLKIKSKYKKQLITLSTIIGLSFI